MKVVPTLKRICSNGLMASCSFCSTYYLKLVREPEKSKRNPQSATILFWAGTSINEDKVRKVDTKLCVLLFDG